MKKISVSIPGCNGRMGKTLLSLILENPKYEIAAATCLPNEEEVGVDIGFFAGKSKINKEIKAEPISLFQNSNVLVDFTVPDATMFHAKECYNNNMSIVIGTTGSVLIKKRNYDPFQKNTHCLFANFSIGVTLLSKLVSNATKTLGFDWDIEVLEMHHKHKVDSPSGTALLLGKSAADARQQELSNVKSISRDGLVGKRKSEEIGFAVLRGGDVVGEHSVLFCNQERE